MVALRYSPLTSISIESIAPINIPFSNTPPKPEVTTLSPSPVSLVSSRYLMVKPPPDPITAPSSLVLCTTALAIESRSVTKRTRLMLCPDSRTLPTSPLPLTTTMSLRTLSFLPLSIIIVSLKPKGSLAITMAGIYLRFFDSLKPSSSFRRLFSKRTS